MAYLSIDIKKMKFGGKGPSILAVIARHFGITRQLTENGPVELIRNFRLTIAQGELVSIVGPSGAGKTTLLRILAGLARSEGEVVLGGERISSPSRKIQVVFQDNCLLPWLNVEDNVFFALRNGTGKRSAIKAETLMTQVGLGEKRRDFPKTLSGGEASRVAFARAFVDPPNLLLLDEPFRALDTTTKERLQDKLIELRKNTSPPTTIVLVSHSIDDAVLLSDRVLVLAKRPLRIAEEFTIGPSGARERSNPELLAIAERIRALLRELDDAKRACGDSSGSRSAAVSG